MGDSLYSVDDLSYTGLTDTAEAYTGSTTMQDVQLGSPLMLDTSYLDTPGVETGAVPDFLSTDLSNADFFSPLSQGLAGTSETAPSTTSAVAQTPTPNIAPASDNSWAALTGLSKFGSSLAGLLGGQPKTVSRMPTQSLTMAGAQIPSSTMSGSMVLVMVIVTGALILLLARGE